MLRVGSHRAAPTATDVVEVTGRAGDVVLTHMQVSHSPSPNTTTRPRQMIGASFVANNIAG
jgi:ectoine hydroxylase-related dioxygenase (phytanoyl-CoA dioxygenase family)